jgi:16S rRNA (cytosine967-C5)-methyltransferase
MVYAIDVNEGRLRILREAAKLQDLVGVVSAIHSDLRSYSVSCETH